ncbi:hypothetical protein EZI54_07225 [Marinobacter halodurans]|uniref:Uncharacterized protein n=1 Tax=Marinobacter halodurans TaxID=2528979 RepID=A0ABY1ZPE9_9GAMM|nr:hypothetical protein [Marinobacter halodurans]TBW57443.1 hypothetical protein EZI54_07225 [Marinobacter halodurans]
MEATKTQVSLYDAVERYHACRLKLKSLGTELESMETARLPGIEDLLQQFQILRISLSEASRKFDVDPDNEQTQKHLKSKDLKIIRNLEILIEQFAGILVDAKEELAA